MSEKYIIDFVYVLQQLYKKFDDHDKKFDCNFRDLIFFISARAYGLKNQFFFQCRMCYIKKNVWSEPSLNESLDINTEAMAGCILTGIGYTQLEESLAAMDISCIV